MHMTTMIRAVMTSAVCTETNGMKSTAEKPALMQLPLATIITLVVIVKNCSVTDYENY